MNSRPLRVLAVLDDVAAAASALEMSSALAHTLQRELTVVYVESLTPLVAASLGVTQVLAHPGATWAPLAARDIELGYRLQAARLRTLVEQVSLRHAIAWSMQVTRGVLQRTALELGAPGDLLLVTRALAAGTLAAPPSSTRARPPRITALVDPGASGEHALQVAQQLAQAMRGSVQPLRVEGPLGADTLAALARAELVVLPRTLAAPAVLAALRAPVLLVG